MIKDPLLAAKRPGVSPIPGAKKVAPTKTPPLPGMKKGGSVKRKKGRK